MAELSPCFTEVEGSSGAILNNLGGKGLNGQMRGVSMKIWHIKIYDLSVKIVEDTKTHRFKIYVQDDFVFETTKGKATDIIELIGWLREANPDDIDIDVEFE